MTPVAIYVHVPFCPSKCGYCDFNSYAMEGDIMARTVQAMVKEIERSPWRGRPAKTVFFGGGTPTYLPEALLVRLIELVLAVHPPIEGAEITSEANPGTVDMPKFRAMRRAGFNRISLGAQSFVPEDLVRLGRVHQASHVGRAVAATREAGFDNLNLDLMFALPGQSSRAWEQNLDLALSLQPDHLSLYCLTIEPNTRFYKLHRRGLLDLPDDEAQVSMYDEAVARMTAAGYAQYEISNFARPGRECRHNLCYWHGEEYLAYGPGAVGCFSPPVARPSRPRLQELSDRNQAEQEDPSGWQPQGRSLRRGMKSGGVIPTEEGSKHDLIAQEATRTFDPSSPRDDDPVVTLLHSQPNGEPDSQYSTDDPLFHSEFPQRGREGRATEGERTRYTNLKHPERYCEAIESGTKLWCEEEVLGPKEREIERVMLGIRLNEGVDASGVDPVASQKLQDRGWLSHIGDRLKLTPEGRHFCSEVTAALI